MKNTLSIKLKEEVKQLKKELAASKRLLSEVQKVSKLGSWELDYSTGNVVWTDELYKIIGLEPQKSLSSLNSFLSFVHPDDLVYVDNIISPSLQSHKNYSLGCRIITVNGNVKHVLVKGIFEFDKNKKPTRRYGIMHDVTELKKAQNEVFLSEIIGQENERERLSKELHDGLGQILFGVNLQLTDVENALRKTDKVLSKKVRVINSTVNDTIEEVRNISHNLSPHMLKKYGLTESLKNICKSTGKIAFSFETNIKGPLNKSSEVVLYRIAQELITNIIRHSEATKAKISLLKKGNEIILIADDNGIGFSKKFRKNRKPGIGLTSIKNRLSMVSGNMKIINGSLHKGALIEISIPI